MLEKYHPLVALSLVSAWKVAADAGLDVYSEQGDEALAEQAERRANFWDAVGREIWRAM
jgi:hypothetical protein